MKTLRPAGLLVLSLVLACNSGEKDGGFDLPLGTCDQSCEDGSFLFATWLAVDDGLYNHEVVGHGLPRGGVACPGGGTVDISGTATNSGGTNSLDLTYVLSGCRFSESGYALSYTGTLTEKGQFNNDTKVTDLTYTSESLTWSGTVGYGSTPYPVNGNACAVLMSRTPTLSGSVCGRHQTSGRVPP